jgi:hypothetical protein
MESISGNAATATTANYATTAGSADKLGSVTVGSINSPVYFSDGKPIATQISFDLTDDNLTINF